MNELPDNSSLPADPLAERLARLTPSAAGLDRDALLFAAGRASVRPNRGWMALVGTLAACQLITLVTLWPTAQPTQAAPLLAQETAATTDEPRTSSSPYQLWALRERMLSSNPQPPSPPASEPLVPDAPPLHAFSAYSLDLSR